MDYKEYAINAHGDQKYGTLPYSTHLGYVEELLASHGFSSEFWAQCAWLHDILEDTEVEYEDLELRFGSRVADTVLAVSGFGANRKTRQLDIKNKLYNNPIACILKCADRIANVATGINENRFATVKDYSKLKMYAGEQPAFKEIVQPIVPVRMWEHLQDLFGTARTDGAITSYD